MAEKVEVDIEINSNIEPSIKALKQLKQQLKETAAGSEEFKKISKNVFENGKKFLNLSNETRNNLV